MHTSFDGQVALVTGGAGGIGQEICRTLDNGGAQVIVADIDTNGAQSLAESLTDGIPAYVDLNDPDSIDTLMDEVRRQARSSPQIFISNAGWDVVESFRENDRDIWPKIIDVNLRSAAHISHLILPKMEESGYGRLIYVSSDSGRVGSAGEAIYSAAKAGLIGLAKTLAREYAKTGITSNIVCPGPCDTPFLRRELERNPKRIAALERAIPMRRLGSPEDIANAVAFFASECSGYITGQTLSVNGGLVMA